MADENDININIGSNPTGVEAGSRRAKGAVKSVTDESKQLDAAFRRLKSSIDPTFKAQEQYNRSLNDAQRLLDANLIKKREYTAAVKAAKAALDEEIASINRNSAAGRAAAAQLRADKAQERQAAQEAARAAAQAAREKVAAERQASREAAAAARQAAQEEKAAITQAATAAKQAAREKADAERAASRAAAEAEKQARREMRTAARQAAADAAAAAAQRKKADREAAAAARDAAAAATAQAKAERQAAAAAQELRASVDPAFAAQMRYNDVMRRATALLMDNKLKTGEWIAIQRQAAAQQQVNVRSMGRFNAAYVQLGYQSQDVVASLASGISPMVILAQQGGQTAAALSTLGGTVGRVAAFMAGPWGAAILGFTMVLGYLWTSEEDGKKKTLDLNDAESRRIATVKELTVALRDYVIQQRQANNENLENLRITNANNEADQARMRRNVTDAQNELNEAQAAYNELLKQPISASKGGLEAQAGQTAAAASRVSAAQRALTSANKSLETSTNAVTESRIALAKATADVTQLDIDHQNRLQGIIDAYRAQNTAVSQIADAKARESAQTAVYQDMLRLLRRENDAYNAAKAREAELRRENAAEIREETRAIFQSREAAIGIAGRELRKAGYNVGENVQFGGVKANHPGMGNVAHGRYAIDVNIPGAGTEALNDVTRRRMDAMVAAYQARGFRVLWNGKVYEPHGQGASYDIPARQNQHRNHVHLEAPQSIVGQPAGSKLANQLIADADRVATEQRRIAEEALQDELANLDFKKELYQDDLYAVLNIQDEKEARIREFYGEDSKEAQNAARDRVRIEHQIQQEQLRIARETIDKKLQIAMSGVDAERDIREQAQAGQGDIVDFQEQAGLISERRALDERRALLDQQYQDQVNYEDRVYTLKANAVRDQLALENLTLEARRQLNNQLEILEADHQAKMATMKASYNRQAQSINLQSANLSISTWRGVAQTITQSLGQSFQGLWTRSISGWQALINLGDQLVYKFADAGLKILENWLIQQAVKMGLIHANEAAQTTIHAGGEAARTGITATGEATRQGIGVAGVAAHGVQQGAKAAATIGSEAVQTAAKVGGEATRGTVGAAGAIAEIGTRAATSAAGAFSSTVVIPFIGPVAAPIAAAAALAAVLGFAALVSARGGQGEVGSDGQLSMLHKKEMVLPAWIAEPFRQQLRTRGSSGPMFSAAAAAGNTVRSNSRSEANFYYQPQNTLQSVSMSELLRRDGRELRRWLYNEHRNGNLRLDRS